MGMTTEERRSFHRAARFIVKRGAPKKAELREGEPTIRTTNAGVFEFVKFNGIVYKKALDKA